MKLLLSLFLLLTGFYTQAETMKLNITLNDDRHYTATLADNPTSRSFARLLPLEVALENYSHNEKIFYPAEKLDTAGAPARYRAEAGDITYYAPWGDVALFFEPGPNAPGLIYLGKFDGDVRADLQSAVKIRFESAQ